MSNVKILAVASLAIAAGTISAWGFPWNLPIVGWGVYAIGRELMRWR